MYINNKLDADRLSTLEWSDFVPDWRWVSQNNDIFRPNPNWFPMLPPKFQHVFEQNEGCHADAVQKHLTAWLRDESASETSSVRSYTAEVLLPMEYDQVRVYKL